MSVDGGEEADQSIDAADAARTERWAIEQTGLRGFMRAGWHQVEPMPLKWGWHLDAICEHLEAVSNGQIQNLVICVPPSATKTLSVSVFWPAWEWAEKKATEKYIFASYAQSLSDRSAKQNRDLINSPWFRSLYNVREESSDERAWGILGGVQNETGVELAKEQIQQVRYFVNNKRGFRFSTSVGGEVTGRHATRLVGDDLAKAQDAQGRGLYDPVALRRANDFWRITLSTREADPGNTAHVMIAQRLHEKDTPAMCLEDASYTRLIIPMEYKPTTYVSTIGWRDPRTAENELFFPKRFPQSFVDRQKVLLGLRDYTAQYNQEPAPDDGVIFKPSWFKYWGERGSRYEQRPSMHKFARVVMSWDCAFKDTEESSYVVGQVWGQIAADFLLLDQVRDRMDIVATLKAILDQRAKWKEVDAVYVEDKANGPAIMRLLQSRVPGLIPVEPDGGKVVRARACSPLIEAGNVFFPSPEIAPWVSELVDELQKFPYGGHNDQVDGMTQALNILRPDVDVNADWQAFEDL